MSTLFFTLAIMYFIPTIIAAVRRRTNTGSIAALNIFLGWSVIGWVVALVWALATDKPTTTVIHVNKEYPPAV